MVRLLLVWRKDGQLILVEFQSHNGAIAASCLAVNTVLPLKSFNPTMVRLLHGIAAIFI